VPYVLLTVLTLAAGLGAFLGVTESPATHSGAVLELVGPCSTNAARNVANAPCLQWDFRGHHWRLLQTQTHLGPGRAVPASPAESEAQPPPGATIPTCTASQLSVGGRLAAGAGTSVGGLSLTNTGASNCELGGYLSLAILDKEGAALYVKTTQNPLPPPAPNPANVVLPAKQANAAQDFVMWFNWCGANPSPITVTLTLPNGGTLVVPPHPGPGSDPQWLITQEAAAGQRCSTPGADQSRLT
jgi:hypothetical protein